MGRWARRASGQFGSVRGRHIMDTACCAGPRLLHALPGRVRIHIPGLPQRGQHWVEARLGGVPGVHTIRANPLTRTMLVLFDPTRTTYAAILAAVAESDTST